MGYVENSLSGDEDILIQAKVHWAVILWPVVFTVLLSPLLLPLIFTVPWLIATLIYKATTELAVTTKKVVGKWGFISRKSIEQRLEKVDSVTVDQTMFGRMLGYGTVTVNGSGISSTPAKFIHDPLVFRHRVVDALEKANQ